MTSFIDKMITIMLDFITVMVMITAIYSAHEILAKHEIMNETYNFLELASNSNVVNSTDIDEFLANINSHGLSVTATFERRVNALEIDKDGNYINTYVIDPTFGYNNTVLNTGDTLRVHVEQVADSYGQKLAEKLLRLNVGRLSFSLATEVG